MKSARLMESLLQRKRKIKRRLRLVLVARRRVEMMTKKREMAVEVVVGAEVDGESVLLCTMPSMT